MEIPDEAGWIRRLDAAHDVETLIDVVRQALAAIPAEEIAQLPVEARGVAVSDLPTLSLWALAIRELELRLGAPGEDRLGALGRLLSRAAQRAAQLSYRGRRTARGTEFT